MVHKSVSIVLVFACCLAAATVGCIRIKPDPVTVEPIHVTVDVNLRVQRELDSVFDEIDASDPTMKTDDKENETEETDR